MLYLFLLFLQVVGAGVILINGLPVYRHIVLGTGQVLDLFSPVALWATAAIALVQTAHWYRVFRVSIPPMKQNLLLSSLSLFAGRLAFIFGAALFSAVFFKHMPELEILPGPGFLLVRGGLLFGVLFSLFCCNLEFERLGAALRDR